jgi:hypothetical protein
MCASALALPSLATPRASLQRLAPILIPGIAVNGFAVLAFGAVHAWLITPIWSRLAGGLPAALLAGLALAWAFDRVAHVQGWHSPIHGFVFGVYTFATLLPATAVDAALRLNGMRLGDTTPGMIGGVALFALAGFAMGWVLSRDRSTALVCAAAALALMVVAGGPLPIVRSPRAAGLSLGVGNILALAGAAIATIRSVVQRRL